MLRDQIEKVIEEELRPKVMADGGDIKLMKVEDGVVTVGLLQTCQCSSEKMLKEFGVVEALEKVPSVKRVKTLVF
jgi:Fe-S cluster biogenesis protein NfuA